MNMMMIMTMSGTFDWKELLVGIADSALTKQPQSSELPLNIIQPLANYPIIIVVMRIEMGAGKDAPHKLLFSKTYFFKLNFSKLLFS